MWVGISREWCEGVGLMGSQDQIPMTTTRPDGGGAAHSSKFASFWPKPRTVVMMAGWHWGQGVIYPVGTN